MKKIILAVSTMIVASTLSASSLKGIEIGSNFSEACEKLTAIYKKEKKNVKLSKSANRCGYETMFLTYFGVTSDDGKQVTSVELPITMFGFSMLDPLIEIAQAYIDSPDAATSSLQSHQDGKYEYYTGYNQSSKEDVKIDIQSIKISIRKRVSFN